MVYPVAIVYSPRNNHQGKCVGIIQLLHYKPGRLIDPVILSFCVAFFLPRIFFSSFNAFFFLNSFLSLFSRVLFLIFLSFSQFFFTLFNFSLSPLSFCSLHHFFVFSLYRLFVPLSLPNILFSLSFSLSHRCDHPLYRKF